MKNESAAQQLIGALQKGMNGIGTVAKTARLFLWIWTLAAIVFMATTASAALFGATLFVSVLSILALVVLLLTDHHLKEAGALLAHLHALSSEALQDHPVVKTVQAHSAALYQSQGMLARVKALYCALEAGKDTLDAGHSGFGVSSLMALTNPMMVIMIGCSLGVGMALAASSPLWALLWIFA